MIDIQKMTSITNLKLSLNTLDKSILASTQMATLPTTPVPVAPTPYRISTITFNGDLNVYIRRDIFFQNASMALNAPDTGFVWMECWMNGTQNVRGIFPKKKSLSKAKRSDATTASEPVQKKNKSFSFFKLKVRPDSNK